MENDTTCLLFSYVFLLTSKSSSPLLVIYSHIYFHHIPWGRFFFFFSLKTPARLHQSANNQSYKCVNQYINQSIFGSFHLANPTIRYYNSKYPPPLLMVPPCRRLRAAFDLLAGYLALLRFDARAALDARLPTVLSSVCEALEFDEEFNVQARVEGEKIVAFVVVSCLVF